MVHKMTKRQSERLKTRESFEDNQDSLTKSQQSARDCRFRKKMRYQYLEEVIKTSEKAVFALRKELEELKRICVAIDRNGDISTEDYGVVVELISKMQTQGQC